MLDNVDIIGEPLGYELGVGDELMDFAQEFKSNLNDNQYYQYVIQVLQGRFEDVTEWPKLGTETYLKQFNNKDIHRCKGVISGMSR